MHVIAWKDVLYVQCDVILGSLVTDKLPCNNGLQDDQDVYILSKVSDIVHALFGTYKEAMLPVFEQLLPHFVKLLVRQHSTWLFHCYPACVCFGFVLSQDSHLPGKLLEFC